MQDPTLGGAPTGPSALSLSTDQPLGSAMPAPADLPPPALGDAAPQAQSLAGHARAKLTGALDGQKDAVADRIETLAQTVHRSAEQFQGQQDWIASAIGRGAAELETIAGTLRGKDLGDLAADVQAFARRKPALFITAALATGFAVARLGKVAAADLSRDDLPNVAEARHGER